jgi:hypothetical protein
MQLEAWFEAGFQRNVGGVHFNSIFPHTVQALDPGVFLSFL